jgi:DNA repair protein RadC
MYVETKLVTIKNHDSVSLHRPEDAVRFIYGKIESKEIPNDVESALLLTIDSDFYLLGWYIIGVGAENTVCWSIKKMFRHTVLDNAEYIACAHTHFLSENSTSKPSKSDIEIAKRISKLCDELGVEVLQHLVLAKTSYSIIKFDDEVVKNN